jgi:hypothetical protein
MRLIALLASFVFICSCTREPSECADARACNDIAVSFSSPLPTNGLRIEVTTSLGATLTLPDEGDPSDAEPDLFLATFEDSATGFSIRGIADSRDHPPDALDVVVENGQTVFADTTLELTYLCVELDSDDWCLQSEPLSLSVTRFEWVPCSDSEPCEPGLFCFGDCVRESQIYCKPAQTACGSAERPVCGCDGVVYPTVCDANANGVDIGGRCDDESMWPEGLFHCLESFCDPTSEYCEIQIPDTQEDDLRGSCNPIPDDCDGITDLMELCECYSKWDNLSSCEADDVDGVLGISVSFQPI